MHKFGFHDYVCILGLAVFALSTDQLGSGYLTGAFELLCLALRAVK